ncbi:MAG: hypothetical protein AAB116_23415 [Candidatus Poribacteria bacterium]
MANKSKINPTSFNREKGRFKPTQIDDSETIISFNFKNLCKGKKGKFDYEKCNINYFLKLIERLKSMSYKKRLELTAGDQGNPKSIRFHRIKFGDDPRLKEETFGLGDDKDEEAYQFEISQNHGRIHGFFVEHVFYIVWLDPDHELYSNK